jgi:hypothetical protein
MGFLIFAYRKLTLKRSLNKHEFEQIQFSMQKQQISDQISVMQQSNADKQDMSQQMMANISNMGYAKIQSSVWMSQQGVAAAQGNFDQAVKTAKEGGAGVDISKDKSVLDAKDQLDLAQKAAAGNQMNTMMAFQQFQSGMMAMNQQINSVFAAKEKGEMAALKSKENRLDLQMKSLESLIASERAEFQSVEKAESEEAKESAPKFGLS